MLRLHSEKGFLASEGRIRLLELVDLEGSIRAAAESMKMSYRHAWGMLKKMEETIGTPLLVSERGGKSGGKSSLTPDAKRMVEFYRDREGAVDNACKYGKKPSLAVDIVIIDRGTADGQRGAGGGRRKGEGRGQKAEEGRMEGAKVVLVRRKNPPHKGGWVLPGGFVEWKEMVEEAAVREAREETGLDIELEGLVGVFSAPERDPRGHTVSVTFLAHPVGGKLVGGDDAAEAKWWPLDGLPELGFDHAVILEDAKRKMKALAEAEAQGQRKLI
ncbi:MAG: NUDIX domain-containing protein [Thermoplasmata archaeon]|nr:NUDIX domain-containing protein [Thermoplasmata archaeon]